MGRTLYESGPVTPELDVRLRRIQSRISRIEAELKLHYQQAGGDMREALRRTEGRRGGVP